MEVSNRVLVAAGAGIAYAIVFLCFFTIIPTAKGLPALYQFSGTLAALAIFTLTAFLLAGEKIGFMTVGITLVVTSLVWIFAPIFPSVWAVNYLFLAAAVKALFGLQGYVSSAADKIVFLLNAIWFFSLCLGIAFIKASPLLRNGFSKAVNTATKTTGTTARSPDAKWATSKQVLDKLSVPGGIVLGEMTNSGKDSPDFEPHDLKTWGKQGKGQLISMSPETGNGHVFVISESSGFKTSGIVISNIVTYDFGPIFVLDPKGDLYARTAHRRREMGYNPIVITAKNGLDPLKMLEPLLDEHPSIIREMAANLLPRNPHSSEEASFFRDRGLDLLSPLLYLAIKQNEVSAPEYISKFLSLPHEILLKRAKKISVESDLPFIIGPMSRVAAVDTKGFESFIRTVSNKFAFSEYPDVKGFVEQPAGSNRHQLALHPVKSRICCKLGL
jgi:type IV secretory pathway TraG/TraD family ATPase VirD4